MSGANVLASTSPTCASVVAGDVVTSCFKGAAAQPPVASSSAITAMRKLVTATNPDEGQVFVIRTEIAVRVGLGHMQLARFAIAGEVQPGVDVDRDVVPMQHVATAEFADHPVHLRRL